MIFHRTPFLLPLLYPTLIWRMPESEKVLYLTFDDGPIPGVTEFVLDTLANYSAKATFFCIGDNVRKYPHIFKRVVEEGHRVGNHTFNHLNGWRTSTHAYLENIQRCEKEIAEHSKQIHKPLFRPPYGRIRLAQIRSLKTFDIIMWDVLSADYDKDLSEHTCLRNTIKAVRNGSIIVFHDSYKAEKNVRFVLPKLIQYFSERGFAFKAIST